MFLVSKGAPVMVQAPIWEKKISITMGPIAGIPVSVFGEGKSLKDATLVLPKGIFLTEEAVAEAIKFAKSMASQNKVDWANMPKYEKPDSQLYSAKHDYFDLTYGPVRVAGIRVLDEGKEVTASLSLPGPDGKLKMVWRCALDWDLKIYLAQAWFKLRQAPVAPPPVVKVEEPITPGLTRVQAFLQGGGKALGIPVASTPVKPVNAAVEASGVNTSLYTPGHVKPATMQRAIVPAPVATKGIQVGIDEIEVDDGLHDEEEVEGENVSNPETQNDEDDYRI